MRQAITTKYLGPTNYRGSRIKASCAGGTMTIPLDHSLNVEARHAKAARALAEKMAAESGRGWCGYWISGGLPSGDGNCYVSLYDAAESHAPRGSDGEDWFFCDPIHARAR